MPKKKLTPAETDAANEAEVIKAKEEADRALLQKEVDAIGKVFQKAHPSHYDTLLASITSRFSESNEDGTQVRRVFAFNMKNAGWLIHGPIAFRPSLWEQYLTGHAKMIALANYLCGQADNNGQIFRLKAETVASDLHFSTTQVLSFITNLAGIGICTIMPPRGRNGKLYLNVQLHAIPMGYRQPNVAEVQPPAPAPQEEQPEKEAA